MAQVLMIDAAADLRPIVPRLRASGYNPAIAAVYTCDGGCGAFVATPQYVSDLHGLGLAVLPVFNGAAIDAGYPGTAAQAAADIRACNRQLENLGVPDGCYAAWDIERLADGGLQGAYLAAVARYFRASLYGGAGIVYGALMDLAFGTAFDAALQVDPANSSRLLFWLASYVVSDPGTGLPAWGAAGGPGSVPWSPSHQAQIVAWQYWDGGPGPTDLSAVGLPLPQYGTEGLWLPDGSVGQPAVPAAVAVPAPAAADVPAALGAIGQAGTALAAARSALGG